MKKIMELEEILEELGLLADTFFVIDALNQNPTFSLPRFAMTVPVEVMKNDTEKAKRLCREIIEMKLDAKS